MIARVTRQSARRVSALASEATTPLSNSTPVMSSRPESVATETPATSDIEDRVQVVKKRSASAPRINGKGKRKAESDEDEDENESAPPAKRRAISQCYVSMPAPSARGRGKQKVRELSPPTLMRWLP
jgi:DNA repair protein RAD16